MYHEIAIQTKTPLSLAFNWLRRLRDTEVGAKADELLDKTLKQLRRVELTYDRLVLSNCYQKEIPYNEVLLDISYLIENIIDEMPNAQAEHISFNPDKNLPYVLGDMYQISFCIETVLSYLLRFCPIDEKIHIALSRNDHSLVIAISGYSPEFTREFTRERQQDYGEARSIADTLVDVAVGKDIINAFVKRNHGQFYTEKRNSNQREFRIELQKLRG